MLILNGGHINAKYCMDSRAKLRLDSFIKIGKIVQKMYSRFIHTWSFCLHYFRLCPWIWQEKILSTCLLKFICHSFIFNWISSGWYFCDKNGSWSPFDWVFKELIRVHKRDYHFMWSYLWLAALKLYLCKV